MVSNDAFRLDFICVHNAGRSQMAAAFAERERADRDLEDVVEIHTGGTQPADAIHEEVVEAMTEVGIDIADRRPKWMPDLDQLADSDYLITMGCTITKFNPEQHGVESHEWNLTDPDGRDMETVREVRDEVERRVAALFDELEGLADERRAATETSGGFVETIRDSLSR
jgi:arsenate reductase